MNIIPKTTIDMVADIAIIGAILVSLGYPFWANVIWTISNPYIAVYNYKLKQFEIAKMFLVYTLIALYGIWNLWPK